MKEQRAGNRGSEGRKILLGAASSIFLKSAALPPGNHLVPVIRENMLAASTRGFPGDVIPESALCTSYGPHPTLCTSYGPHPTHDALRPAGPNTRSLLNVVYAFCKPCPPLYCHS